MTNTIELCLIAAIAKNGAIGFKNRIPWHLPADLRHFKTLTLNCPVIMGKRTFESLPQRLPKRRMIVVSHTLVPQKELDIVPSLNQATKLCAAIEHHHSNRVFVIGGARLYQEALPIAQRLYLTEIDQAFTGDTFFPEWPIKGIGKIWHEVHRESHQDPAGLNFAFVEYVHQDRAKML